MELRRRFGSADKQRMVMVCQIRTMSLAVNELVTASHAVFATPPQQRDDLVQARDRLNRLGQTQPVTFWYAVAPKTVDEVVMTSHRHRTSLEQAMLRHVRGEQ
jgi:SNF2 family DNA or RNA helicase